MKGKRLMALAVLLSAMGLRCLPLHAWGETGHRITAEIATAYLTATARKEIESLLPQEVTLADAAVWPDQVGRRIPDMNEFHFINFLEGTKGYDRERDCKDRNCIVEALGWYRRTITDRDAPKNSRRIALYFVTHLVGDLHQPLHAGRLSDLGGNRIKVTFRGRDVNLHSLWDSDFVEALNLGTPANAAKLLIHTVTSEEKRFVGGTPVEWTWESWQWAQSVAYRTRPGAEINQDYATKALSVVRHRLALAGVRLAQVLNEAFP